MPTWEAQPLGHLVPPYFGTCTCFTSWDQSLSQTCRIFTWLYTLWTSLGNFSTFLSNFRCRLLVMTGGSPVMIKGQGRLLALLVKPFVGTMQASFWPIYSLKVISKPKNLQTDGRTYRWTDRQMTDKVIPKWRSASLATDQFVVYRIVQSRQQQQ